MPAVRTTAKNKAYEIETTEAIQWVIDQAVGPANVTNQAEESLRLTKATADLKEEQHRLLSGETGKLADIESALAATFVSLRTTLEGLPGRRAAEFATITDPAAIRQALQDELRRAVNIAEHRTQDYLDDLAQPGAATRPSESSAVEMGGGLPRATGRQRRTRSVPVQ